MSKKQTKIKWIEKIQEEISDSARKQHKWIEELLVNRKHKFTVNSVEIKDNHQTLECIISIPFIKGLD